MLKLTTNNEHKGQPDTPQHHFKKVLRSLYLARSFQSDYDATWTYAIGLTANNELDVRTLMVKYPETMPRFEWLYAITPFQEFGFNPKALVEAHKIIWGVSNEPTLHDVAV
jgi:hypothetical protein